MNIQDCRSSIQEPNSGIVQPSHRPSSPARHVEASKFQAEATEKQWNWKKPKNPKKIWIPKSHHSMKHRLVKKGTKHLKTSSLSAFSFFPHINHGHLSRKWLCLNIVQFIPLVLPSFSPPKKNVGHFWGVPWCPPFSHPEDETTAASWPPARSLDCWPSSLPPPPGRSSQAVYQEGFNPIHWGQWYPHGEFDGGEIPWFLGSGDRDACVYSPSCTWPQHWKEGLAPGVQNVPNKTQLTF